jgi:hypothetical protein
MTDDGSPEAVQFEAVLEELRLLTSRFAHVGTRFVLVGGQVLALEARAAGGSGVIEVRTPTDIVIPRGYSMEPDLLFDVDEAGPRSDAILDILKDQGFKRVREFRWRKEVEGREVLLDLFMPPDADEENNPGGFTRLPMGDVALLRPRQIQVQLVAGVLDIAVPDPVGFLAMKLEAKLKLRPTMTKDAFDIYAYVAMKGTETIRHALVSDRHDGPRIAQQLAALFGEVGAPGVLDVLSYAGTLEEGEQALVARAVVDLFESLA